HWDALAAVLARAFRVVLLAAGPVAWHGDSRLPDQGRKIACLPDRCLKGGVKPPSVSSLHDRGFDQDRVSRVARIQLSSVRNPGLVSPDTALRCFLLPE